MSSYAQQFGPGSVWYYPEETPRQPPPPPPAVPMRYMPQSGDVFNQTSVYTPMYTSTDAGVPIQTPTTSFGTPRHYENSGSSGRQESSPPDGVDRRRYRIKRIRTACETCRARKQRRVCDGSEPCGPCIEQGTHCRYRDIPPAKKDAMIQKMLELVEQHSEYLESITEDIEGINRSLKDVEKRLAKQK